MASVSNKARTYECLVEIRDTLEKIVSREPTGISLYELDRLLHNMEVSVNSTEGTDFHRFTERRQL